MSGGRGASRARPGRLLVEWPTWVALAGCYGAWGLLLGVHGDLGWLYAIPAAVVVAFHSSLQHEILHGHPTRNAALNEALVFPTPGLFIPYRRFRDLHLTHHNDERLTDPYDDPESFYVSASDWQGRCSLMRLLLAVNATFAGRMLIGPALAMWGFWRGEIRLMRVGNPKVRTAWALHALGLVPVIGLVWASGMNPLFYVFAVAYPAMSLIMVRSYIEHRAAGPAPERTAIVEAGWFWRLLFLNNNFHAVHHASPAMAWYKLPDRWRTERDAVLARNGGYLVPGYGAVARRWFFKRREPVIHPWIDKPNDAA